MKVKRRSVGRNFNDYVVEMSHEEIVNLLMSKESFGFIVGANDDGSLSIIDYDDYVE